MRNNDTTDIVGDSKEFLVKDQILKQTSQVEMKSYNLKPELSEEMFKREDLPSTIPNDAVKKYDIVDHDSTLGGKNDE